MTDLHQLQFYATPEHACSYLEGELAKTVFVDPEARLDSTDYSFLSDLGFRRSGDHIYRPHCQHCHACISARIPVDLFRPGRNQRRVMRQNRELLVSEQPPYYSDELYQLYQRYICQRHQDGDMYPPSEAQFEAFLVRTSFNTRFFEFRLGEQLLAVAVADQLEHGLSAIYTFFDPQFQQRSLGRLAILTLIQRAQKLGLPYLYLGYWVKGCRKMDYKINYQPIQLLIDGHWLHLSKGEFEHLDPENILRQP